MYYVLIDGVSAYDPSNEKMRLIEPKLELELNKTGSFTFTMYPQHQQYNLVKKLKSIVEVWDETQLVFRGRVLNDEAGFYNQKEIYCEGELSFLLDSRQRPYDYQGTITGMLTQLLDSHNEQLDEERKFKLGNVTVTDSNDYVHYSDTTYLNTWDSINDKLIDTHGGYVFVRHEADGNYLDYLADFTLLSNQPVEFGRNLLDLTRSVKGEDVISAVIPLGKRDEESDRRLTIESANGGVDYVQDDEAVAQYGFVCGIVEFDDVTDAYNLKQKGLAYLAEKVNLKQELELSAVDLAALDADFNSFHLGTYVKVTSEPHGLDVNLLVSKLDIRLDSPSSNTLTLGQVFSSFTDQLIHESTQNRNEMQSIRNQIHSQTVAIESNIYTIIEQIPGEIMQQVGEDYYLKDDAEALIESVNTQFTQTKEDFTFAFNNFSQDLESMINGTDAKFQDISKYIRFVDGDIVLGEEGNELTLRISNDRIQFLQGSLEVAYFSNQKLYVRDGEYINSLQLGNFAFLPRANGNLSFKKVVN